MATYYTPSGKVSPMSYIYFILVALIALPILGLIYAYAIWYIPFIYINFIIAGCFGLGVGFLINFVVVKLGKVRSKMWAMIFGILAAFIALYFHWVSWVDLVINAGESDGSQMIVTSNVQFGQIFSLAMNPGALFSIIGEINEFGTWGFKNTAVSGTFLTIIWIIEALIIIVAAFLLSSGAADEPFCEENQKWFDRKDLAPFAFVLNPTTVVKELESGNESVFDEIGRPEEGGENPNFSKFTLYANETNENYLSIENQRSKLNDKGEIEFDAEPVVNYISISEALSKKLEGAA